MAFWVQQDDGTSQRLSAFGAKTGRRQAWLVYGTERRLGDVRGKPLLSMVLQSLREIDRYRDSVQRKAVIHAMLAMFIKKDADKSGVRPITGGAVQPSVETYTDTNGKKRSFDVAEQLPGGQTGVVLPVIRTQQRWPVPVRAVASLPSVAMSFPCLCDVRSGLPLGSACVPPPA